ncbi:HNH endonuclease [Microbacterium sp. 1P10UB]|uniref:HNH endonuclease n=1 Tax=unclassified Microbacterium TaxID=2609290 RepID=UPI0039A31190
MSVSSTSRLVESARLIVDRLGDGDPTSRIVASDDDGLLALLADCADAQRSLSLLVAVATAEVERRSDRSRGYDGLSQRLGHRTGTDLVQSLTGTTRADVRRATAVGEDLRLTLDARATHSGVGEGGAGADDAVPIAPPWFAALVDGLTRGELTRDQYDAIRRGLGEPPIEHYPEDEGDIIVSSWRVAAAQLLDEAPHRNVEDLAAAARLARDSLDPIGVQIRFDERFERRSFRAWIDSDGQHHARIVFDDDAAMWVHTILSAALRPRRGPRFAASTVPHSAPPQSESASGSGSGGGSAGSAVVPHDGRPADEEDRRTNEQLQYDTLLAILRTGAAADPAQAFGDRQPGVRLIRTMNEARRSPVIVAEETGQVMPSGIGEQYECDAGRVPVWADSSRRPLDVGRHQRLFTKAQRTALAVRDGGCVWCGAPPSRCEAHHIRHWHAHHGSTDLADGVLLCRNCHMRLHNQGWRIARRGTDYHLHPPDGGRPRLLRPRSLLRFVSEPDPP